MKKLWLFLPFLLITACGSDKTASDEEGGMQKAEQVAIFESKDSQKKWVLNANAVDFSDLNNAELTKPVLLLKEEGKDSAGVKGDFGTFDYAKRLVTIERNAEVRSFKEDITITTSKFFYDVDNDRIWSDDKTIVLRGNAQVTAKQGIETDSKLERIEFKKQQTKLPDDVSELRVSN